MENRHGHIFGIVDSYSDPDVINSTVKAGTEELDFYSETDTYNRDNIPCFVFLKNSNIIRSGLDAIVEQLKSLQKPVQKT